MVKLIEVSGRTLERAGGAPTIIRFLEESGVPIFKKKIGPGFVIVKVPDYIDAELARDEAVRYGKAIERGDIKPFSSKEQLTEQPKPEQVPSPPPAQVATTKKVAIPEVNKLAEQALVQQKIKPAYRETATNIREIQENQFQREVAFIKTEQALQAVPAALESGVSEVYKKVGQAGRQFRIATGFKPPKEVSEFVIKTTDIPTRFSQEATKGIVTTIPAIPASAFAIATKPTETARAAVEKAQTDPVGTAGRVFGGALVLGAASKAIGGVAAKITKPKFQVKTATGVVRETVLQPKGAKPLPVKGPLTPKPVKIIPPKTAVFTTKEISSGAKLITQPGGKIIRIEQIRPVGIEQYITAKPPPLAKVITFKGVAYTKEIFPQGLRSRVAFVPIKQPTITKVGFTTKIIGAKTQLRQLFGQQGLFRKQISVQPTPKIVSIKSGTTTLKQAIKPTPFQKLESFTYEVTPIQTQIPLTPIVTFPSIATLGFQEIKTVQTFTAPQTIIPKSESIVVPQQIIKPTIKPLIKQARPSIRIMKSTPITIQPSVKTQIQPQIQPSIPKLISPVVPRLQQRPIKIPKETTQSTFFLPPTLIFPEEKRKKKKKLYRKRLKQPRRFVPSLIAREFGITSMRQPRLTTGFGIRPIVINRRRKR